VRLLTGDRLFWAGGGIAVLAGAGLALSRAWVCDDAFIRFRYAVNLVRGHGLVYHADPAVAVESETGLTDATIARQDLTVRGRPGHEKLAPLDYVVRVRRLHFLFDRGLAQRLLLAKALPNVTVEFDGVRDLMLRWDPEVLAALVTRGARFPDAPVLIDQYVARLSEADDASLRDAYRWLKTSSFDHVADEAREALFRARPALRPSRP
jgi:hypothetical protein